MAVPERDIVYSDALTQEIIVLMNELVACDETTKLNAVRVRQLKVEIASKSQTWHAAGCKNIASVALKVSKKNKLKKKELKKIHFIFKFKQVIIIIIIRKGMKNMSNQN